MSLYGYSAFIMPYFFPPATSTYDSNAVVNGVHSNLWENKGVFCRIILVFKRGIRYNKRICTASELQKKGIS